MYILRLFFCATISLAFVHCFAADGAAEWNQKGIAALKDSQSNPTSIVTAARCFAKAAALYEAGGKTDLAVEMNSYLYWCKKKMTLQDIEAFQKVEETVVSRRIESIDTKAAPRADAKVWLERAHAFARANPDEHFLIAVRYFEVADRFKGTDESLAAQDVSLKEVQLALSRGPKDKLLAAGEKMPVRAEKPTALSWLAAHQEADGHWDARKYSATLGNDIGVTSLALLAFLGAGHTEKSGEYSATVRRALTWLKNAELSHTNPEFAAGCSAPLLALTLAEASAMTGSEETKVAAQRALDYCMTTYPIGVRPEKNDRRVISPADTIVVGWLAIALKSAKVAGLRTDRAAAEVVSNYLDAVEHGQAYWSTPNDKFGDGQSAHTISAMACLARRFSGKNAEELRPVIDSYLKTGGLPKWAGEDRNADLLYWYAGTMNAYQAGDVSFNSWNSNLKSALLEHQQPDGGFPQKQKPNGYAFQAWGDVGQTALACLCLEVGYRYEQLMASKKPNRVNLLELIDPRKNKTVGRGKWQIFGDHLSSDAGVRGFVQIPYHPPEEYDFNVEFTMQKSRLVVFVLPGPNTQFEFQIGASNCAGFEMVSGKRSDENETAKPFTIAPNRKYKATVKVRRTGIAAYIDDKLITELKTDFKNLSLHEHWVIPDKRALAITNDLVVTTYYSISIDEISGQGEVVKPAR